MLVKRTPFNFLAAATIVMAMVWACWMALLNNFAIESAQFTGKEMGFLQSLREIPGFLAFTAVFILLVLKEQTFALIALALFSIGVAATGFFPFEYGLYATTVLMSIGFHYYETLNQSLSLQWFKKDEAPHKLGQLMSVKSAAALIAYGLIWFAFSWLEWSYSWVYFLFGVFGLSIVIWLSISMPKFPQQSDQHKKIILRKKYSLFYSLTFLSGARRQIFVVFAGFLMVEKFNYSVAEVTALYMLNHLINFYLAPKIGRLIGQIGERRALTIEYIGLIFVFVGYGLVEHAHLAAALYIIDHLFFAMSIALKTYFQKIAQSEDIASTAGVSFTINHIAAVIIPALFGILWLVKPDWVFFAGAALAMCSLVLSQWIPNKPKARLENQFQSQRS